MSSSLKIADREQRGVAINELNLFGNGLPRPNRSPGECLGHLRADMRGWTTLLRSNYFGAAGAGAVLPVVAG